MASPAHCFYCFECLSASFNDTEPPKLSVIEDLWDEFESSRELTLISDQDSSEDRSEAEVGPTRQNATAETGHSNRKSQSDGSGSTGAGQQAQAQAQTRADTLRLPSVGRLQEATTSLRSSNSSTPSALSTSSSRSVLTSATSVASPPSSTSASLLAKSEAANSPRYPTSSSGVTYPLFVTWNTLSKSGQKTLRGCIGTFEAQELAEGLKSYALTSAFGDTRFSPIPAALLPSLSCSLTLLSSFETCSHPLDWDLGTHGLRISFVQRGRRHGATYLPDVAVEQGWTKEEAVESLMRKAGWDGYTGVNRVSRRFLRGSTNATHNQPWEEVTEFKTVRYRGLKASADYVQWQEWRKWAASSATGRAMLQ